MESTVFSEADRQYLRARGLTPDAVLAQIATFERGIPFTVLHRPCTVGDGIVALQDEKLECFAAAYADATLAGRTMKFVPASGAASRMFKLLLTFLSHLQQRDAAPITAAQDDPEAQEFWRCMRRLKQFAFYDDLDLIMAKNGLDLETLAAQEQYDTILEYLLLPKGLNYAGLPKALLKFHRYADHCRTPLEEHLVEAAAYTRDRNGTARLHFTVTPAHLQALTAHLQAVRRRYEPCGTRFDVSFSTQKPCTDTIAVDLHNRPFRDQQGRLLFRPGGHGALLTNLQELGGDIVFIKNIDNVVPDHLKPETVLYKRALGGYLVWVQKQIFTYLRQLETPDVTEASLAEIRSFSRHTLFHVPSAALEDLSLEQQRRHLVAVLNRPLRLCGMVRNVGEPGGGPFWVQHDDGSLSLQIVETSQVDTQDHRQREILAAATHFNPVDLVCGVRDYQGKPFDLSRYTDPNTGFISTKSHQGQELKALELPGLWNGAMAKWNTIFVEVPLATFNPVKTVVDLLRPQHQP